MRPPGWITRGVVGIVLATFFSDVGHEMVTAVLPLYLESIGLGAAALGIMEGVADFLFSLAKLAGGAIGHRTERKKPLAALGYLGTAIGSAAMALAASFAALALLRGVAWFGRGFRSPLRDFLLADEVEPSHFGRAYGVERTSDMLGAVAGPIVAIVLVSLGVSVKTIILVSAGPALISVVSIASLTRDKGRAAPAPASASASASASPSAVAPSGTPARRAPLPRAFWIILGGVVVFGIGDFARSFLVLLVARAATGGGHASALSTAVGLYVLHNLVSAIVAYPTGRLGDRHPKLAILTAGYALGVLTNVMLAINTTSLGWLGVVVVLSGTYIAIQETIEKATVAELLPREQRSLGLGILASANAVGDMVSSVAVGLFLSGSFGPTGARLAFVLPAAASALGTTWMFVLARHQRHTPSSPA